MVNEPQNLLLIVQLKFLIVFLLMAVLEHSSVYYLVSASQYNINHVKERVFPQKFS